MYTVLYHIMYSVLYTVLYTVLHSIMYTDASKTTSEHDGRVLEQLGVHCILQFPAVGLDLGVSVPCI